ncbi:MAG: hypothetical protein JNK79_07560 [Chitinophagaceae bacterium]|nr:hypothetical protein [Chitinophagaceae bacterium]
MADAPNYSSSNSGPSPYLRKDTGSPGYNNQQNSSPNAPAGTKNFGEVKMCFAFSEFFGQAIAKSVGDIAEAYINLKLIPTLLENKVSLWELYWDPSFEGLTYIGFLRTWNSFLPPGIDSELGRARPDILIHNNAMKEYYEIKPDSKSGRSAGYQKLRDLIDIYKTYGLPYKQGQRRWVPETIDIGKTTVKIGTVPVPVTVQFGLRQEGPLIVYNLCITTNWAKVLTSREFLKILIEAILDLLKQAFRQSGELLNLALAYISNNWGTILKGVGGALVLAALVVLTSEITVPAALIAAIAEFFATALAARGLQLATQ